VEGGPGGDNTDQLDSRHPGVVFTPQYIALRIVSVCGRDSPIPLMLLSFLCRSIGGGGHPVAKRTQSRRSGDVPLVRRKQFG
jgi:hypothetical protein